MCIMKNVEIVLKKGGKGKKNKLVERTESQRVKNEDGDSGWRGSYLTVDRGQCVCPQRYKRPSGSISV